MTTYTGTNGPDLYDFNGLSGSGGTIDGLAGQDTIDGSSNNNHYLYDLENNILSLTSDTFLHTLLNFEEVIGGNGNDKIVGGIDAAINDLDGGAGNDTVSPGSNGILTGDVYTGGSGIDVLDFSNLSADHVIDTNTGEFSSFGQIATIFGFEEIIAGSGNDFIREQTAIQSTLHGGLGNDTLATAFSGVGGGEVFDGGEGTDLFDFSNQSVSYNANLLTGKFNLRTGGDDTTLQNIEQVSAGSGNDWLTAGSVNSAVYSLFGNDGNDTIYARTGALVAGDTYDGGTGEDMFDFSSMSGGYRLNTNTGSFTTSDRSIVGTATNFEIIIAGSGNDIIGGNSGDQEILGNAGNDTLTGGDGDDYLDGGDDQDILRADNGNDALNGGSGNDFGSGGDGNDELYGGTGFDWL